MPIRTRKERFKTALLRADMTQEKWRSTYYKVSRKHLTEVLNGNRPLLKKLRDALDTFIREQAA